MEQAPGDCRATSLNLLAPSAGQALTVAGWRVHLAALVARGPLRQIGSGQCHNGSKATMG